MKQISILGCGWLGLPLAKQLVQKGYAVKGSTTSSDKIELLKNLEILPYSIIISAEEITGSTESFLENSEVLIINIPPKLRAAEKEDFVSKIQLLIPHIEKSTILKVIFVSSTSVYADVNEVIMEDSVYEPATESGRQLLASESILKSNTSFQTTIVRFGGLIGEDRHPIRFLAGRKNIENPEAPINLIHLEDCIGIIVSIIEQDSWDQTFNAVTPFHPSRKEYYSQKAMDMNLDLPEFNSSSVSNGKTISSAKIQKILNYRFKVNEL